VIARLGDVLGGIAALTVIGGVLVRKIRRRESNVDRVRRLERESAEMDESLRRMKGDE
jgi:molybdenum-dependent DNA-binding transcriptional regulator ModE